jgi:hypothetical protein
MGIDAEIYAKGDLTRADVWFELETTSHKDFGLDNGWWNDTVFVDTIERWYGPGYERGYWPTIYKMIRQMQAMYPKAIVYYRSDNLAHDKPGMECTAENLEQLWQHYLGPNGDDYHR